VRAILRTVATKVVAVLSFLTSLPALATAVDTSRTSIFDPPVRYDEPVPATKARVFDEFFSHSTGIVTMVIESITRPTRSGSASTGAAGSVPW
jgi:hypothetical protein